MIGVSIQLPLFVEWQSTDKYCPPCAVPCINELVIEWRYTAYLESRPNSRQEPRDSSKCNTSHRTNIFCSLYFKKRFLENNWKQVNQHCFRQFPNAWRSRKMSFPPATIWFTTWCSSNSKLEGSPFFVSVERASNKEEHFLEQSRAFLGEEKTKLQKQTHGTTRLTMLNTMMSSAVRFSLPEAETTILLIFQFS